MGSEVSPFIFNRTNEVGGACDQGFPLHFECNQRAGDKHVIRGFPLHFEWNAVRV